MGKCFICGKKGFLLDTNKCFSCGKEVCKNCSGDIIFTVDFMGSITRMCSCSEDCLNAFRRYLSSFELQATTTLKLDDLNRQFNNILKDFLAKRYPEFRQPGEVSLRTKGQAFNRITENFYDNYKSNAVKNLKQAECNGPVLKRFNVKHLGSAETEGRLLVFNEKIVFEPKDLTFSYRRLEMEVGKIKDVRFTTEKEVSALRVFLLGPTLGVLFKSQHHMLTIDYEDELGITQHPIFEDADMESAIEEINEIRRNAKLKTKGADNPYG
jgi:hypothetical protein